MQDASGINEFIGVFVGAYYLVFLICTVFFAVCMWKIFQKAGKPGWSSLIPFYSNYQLFDIAYGDGWKFLLLIIPFVNIVISIQLYLKLAKSFGQGTLFGLGLLCLPYIFFPIMAFSKNVKYIGPYAKFL
jgi:hypothetical protein